MSNSTQESHLNLGNLPPLLTVPEAAPIARVSEKHVRHLCNEGAFRARMVGGTWRINTASFLDYIGL